MIVSELIELLQELPQDALVTTSSDPEGNGFDEVSGWSVGWWDPQNWEYRNFDDVDDEDVDAYVETVCIWP